MKGINLVKGFVALSALSFMLSSCDKTTVDAQEPVQSAVVPQSDEGAIIEGQYIVIMNESAYAPALTYLQGPIADRATKAKFMKAKDAEITAELKQFLINQGINTDNVIAYYTAATTGFAIKLSDEEMEKLSKSDKIELIEHDRREQLPEFTVDNVDRGVARAQTTPCGISRAGGAGNGASKNTWAWIIDTGIDLDHPDLNVQTNTSYARSFAGGNANDCNGHGTHVAGTVAAINNSTGVIGMSAGAVVVPVKVFGCSGGSASSTILSGINHVAANDIAGDAVNLSLGGYYGSNCANGSPYRNSLVNMGNAGTLIAIAAGNSSGNTALYSPGCVNGTNIRTVASMTCNRSFSSFSNYNMNPCDYIATGSSVYSTYLNGGYATLSGTSMATPHVAGIMHVRGGMPRTSGSVSNRGESYPIAVR
jgi:subtilisin family serine protease